MATPTQRKLARVWWRVVSWVLPRTGRINEASTMYIISAFPRSGSSLVAQMLDRAVITFGPERAMRDNSDFNPEGFFENLDFYRIIDRLFREAGWKKNYGAMRDDIRAQGVWRKFARMFTRRRLRKFVIAYTSAYQRWAVKISPLGLSFLKGSVGTKVKLIGVYRDPFAAAYSGMKINRNGELFETMLRHWAESYRELLYQLFVYDGILICYEDLIDPMQQERVLARLAEYLECGDVDLFKQAIKPKLNRSSIGMEHLRATYPLSFDVRSTLEALERAKI